MVTMNDIRKAARDKGCTVSCESSGNACVWQIDAPLGYCWEEGQHALKIDWNRGDAAWRNDALLDGLDRIRSLEIMRCECREAGCGEFWNNPASALKMVDA